MTHSYTLALIGTLAIYPHTTQATTLPSSDVVFAESPSLRAQSQRAETASLEFEAASVKRSKNGGQPRLRYNPAGLDFANVPLIWIVGEAYQVPYARISSSDSHLRDLFFSPTGSTYFYDITARVGRSASKEDIRLMLRAMLASRFKLTLHHESKEMPVYKLVVGKSGLKLHESAAEGEPVAALGARRLCMPEREMARFAYDFTLKSDLEGGAEKVALTEWFVSSIFADIQKQLGLVLQADKAAIDYLVVEHVEQPSEN